MVGGYISVTLESTGHKIVAMFNHYEKNGSILSFWIIQVHNSR
jgi:hypothetical protein